MKNQWIDKYFKLGSDGFIALKDFMGSDEDIERAARVSYGKGTRKTSETKSLLRYLMRHKHTSPFEMSEMVFHIRIPIDAMRQLVRHRTANINEYSTRYSEAIDSNAITDPTEWRLQSSNNKQGSSGNLKDWPFDVDEVYTGNIDEPEYYPDNLEFQTMTPNESPGDMLSRTEQQFHDIAKSVYKQRLKFGIAREQARKDLPLSTYTELYWKCDLRNILHFMGLRCDSHAQLEIREYANVMACLVKECFPITFEAWYDYQFTSITFSRLEQKLLKAILTSGLDINDVKNMQPDYLSKREFAEFISKFENFEPVFDINSYKEYNVIREDITV